MTTEPESPAETIQLGIALAQRWGVIVVPDGVTVKACGWSFVDGQPHGREGTIELIGQTEAAGQVSLVECSFEITSTLETVTNVVVWLRDRLAESFDREDG